MPLLIIIAFLLLAKPIHAQSTPTPAVTVNPVPTSNPADALYEKYNQDYLYQYSLYTQAYLDYTNKKQVYTKYGTITTQKDKFEATKNALLARNNVIKAYLIALRVKLDIYKDSNQTDTEADQIEISKWESWCDEQSTIITSINNEDDMAKWAANFKDSYISIQQIVYKSLVQDEINLRASTLQDIHSLSSNIQSSIQNLSPEGLQWFNSLPVTSDLVSVSFKNAMDYSTKNKQYSGLFNNFYPSSKSELNKANGYLLEMLNQLKSIVIKFAAK